MTFEYRVVEKSAAVKIGIVAHNFLFKLNNLLLLNHQLADLQK